MITICKWTRFTYIRYKITFYSITIKELKLCKLFVWIVVSQFAYLKRVWKFLRNSWQQVKMLVIFQPFLSKHLGSFLPKFQPQFPTFYLSLSLFSLSLSLSISLSLSLSVYVSLSNPLPPFLIVKFVPLKQTLSCHRNY
jgi:hypothetical protein